ncbi:MAG: metallophosphoesterase family protein [Promethearchaeota archaeon]
METQLKIRVGLLSDTHFSTANTRILDHVIEYFREKQVDYVMHLGDFTTSQVHSRLKKAFGAENVFAVLGNMDAWDTNLSKILPETRNMEILGTKIFLTHGSGSPTGIIARLKQTHNLSDYDLVLFGHTHQAINIEAKPGSPRFINPGTCTRRGSFAILTFTETEPTIQVDFIYL